MAAAVDGDLLGGLYDLPIDAFAQAAEPDAEGDSPGVEREGGAALLSAGALATRADHEAPAPGDTPPHEESSGSSASQQQQRQQQDGFQAAFTCVTCGAAFESLEEQREHFRSDWHRYNLKRRLRNAATLSEAEFEALVAKGGDEVESISGSDTDSGDDEEANAAAQRRSHRLSSGPKAIFTRADGSRFALWRCLLEAPAPKQLSPVPEEEGGGGAGSEASLLLQRLVHLRRGGTAARWMVVLASGGHFAAAVFQWREGKGKGPACLDVVLHKTFHKYVVRAKAGGRQSTKDGNGKTIKSAGSALRRANEAALAKDIRETLDAWKDEIAQVGLVFVHSSRADTGTLFVGDGAPLSRSDPRVRRIPFATRRPTLAEVKRVVVVLASVWDLGAAPAPQPASRPSVPAKAKANKPASDAPAEPEAPAAPPPVLDSPLHVASKAGNHEEVKRLLEEAGADPCEVDARGKTPYEVALDKPTRDAFRRYMAAEPDRWDYHAAAIPSALTAELEEQQDAKRAEKDAKRREKERERKKAAKERKKAAEEQARAIAAAEVEAAAAAAAAQASRLQLGDKKKKAGSGQGGKKGDPVGDKRDKRPQRERRHQNNKSTRAVVRKRPHKPTPVGRPPRRGWRALIVGAACILAAASAAVNIAAARKQKLAAVK